MKPRFAQCLCTLSYIAGLAACGSGGDDPPPTVNQPVVFTPSPLPCTNNNYSLGMRSPSGPVTGEPRVMQAFVTLSGCTRGTLSGVPIDWTVDGGGSISGQVSVRTLTDSEGIATVTWVFGPGTGRQTIEAEYRGAATPRRVAISHTVLPVGPNPAQRQAAPISARAAPSPATRRGPRRPAPISLRVLRSRRATHRCA